MSESKCNCSFCYGDNTETADSIIVEYLDNLLNAKSPDEIRESIYNLFNQAFMMGVKESLVERIENDIKALNFMNNTK